MSKMTASRVFEAGRLGDLFAALHSDGWKLVGPRVRDGAIVYDEIGTPADLPAGWTDEQAPGSYRLRQRGDGALFGYVVGPHSWKRYLFPPAVRLWTASRARGEISVSIEPEDAPATALVGVRACELAAIAIQDKVLLGGTYADSDYRARRDRIFLLAVNCGQAGGTCFCASMNTGPRAQGGFDISLTEILDGGHRFLAEAGSERGTALLQRLGAAAAGAGDETAAEKSVANAVAQMGRSLQTEGLPALMQRNLEHPRWEQVAQRCLACSNCTMVCPTCFCSSAEDAPDLPLGKAERWRRWDSCFSADFSYIHGGSVRPAIRSRYRQWIVHKLSTWHEQFGTSGCVGCGRCITWCPSGIDITEEAREIRASEVKT